MKLYAERPGRVARQLLADLLGLAWLAGFGWAAAGARELMLRLQVPANSLTNAGTSIGDAFAGAARTAAKVPFVGAQLAAALDTGRAAGQSLAGVGEQQLTTIAELATGTAVLVALVGALPALVLWLPPRIRYARLAGAAVACRERNADLLALRALTAVSVRRLRAVTEDPASGWRRNDPDVVRRLAALELRRLGLRAPR
ncbi:MAG: hypothetical protein QOI50_2780 [Pseudonocardiales bacterium]|jgi:hypothetical protein|nr:hypothetical protein [Pseudonocardia sp.]MDT7630850.1 hypothetical protein [Pseudonocardiales bacterium]